MKGYAICTQRREDCFAYTKDGKCQCLRDGDFGDKPCPFFKTTEQYMADQLKYMRADNGN